MLRHLGRGRPIQRSYRSIAEQFAEAWPRFETPDSGEAFLDVRVSVGGDPVPDGTVDAKAMRTTFDAGSAGFAMKGGTAHAVDSGRLDVCLAPSGASTQFIALLNLTLAALAWRMSRTRGVVLHSAGIILRDRAVVLVGPAGSGKTTFVRLATDAGARSLGDDLVLLDGSRGQVDALGTPLRPRPFGSPGPGRWPVAAVLLPRHGAAAAIDTAAPAILHARLVANLPWIAEAMSPTAMRFVDDLIAHVPFRTLTFAMDSSFMAVIERFLEEREGA